MFAALMLLGDVEDSRVFQVVEDNIIYILSPHFIEIFERYADLIQCA